ncbi:MAG TPA: outer membrane protein assembly factor BamD [Thermodesulfobacteriota bacterium]|nr:outer membrane protein assembly factor BamD [Thermodesulfobacteriota bacterium]
MNGAKRNFSNKLLLPILSSVFLLVWSNGCALFGKKEPATTPQAAYDEGVLLLEKKKYERSAEAFRKFKEDYPLSTYTPLAELRLGDSLYFDKNYAEAIVQYEEFKKLHPVHAEIPHAIYQIGMCYFKQMLSIDRDQTVTEKALEQFRYVVENFPQSKYLPDAKTKMQLCQRQLADQEFDIGYFYYRMGYYKAALGRFEEILKKFPDAGLERKITPLMKTCREKIAKEEKKLKEKEGKEAKKKQS